MSSNREFDRHCTYCIRVQGNLNPKWADWFDGMAITPQEDGHTALVGAVADQASLYGMLTKICDLGLPLLQVQRLERDEAS